MVPKDSLMPSFQCIGEESSIGLAIGLSLLFLLALYSLVVIILVVVAVVVKRKAACKQKRDMARRDEEYYTAVIVKQEMEMKEKSVDSDYDYAGYKDTDDVNPHMAADREANISTRRPAPNMSSFLAGASNTPARSERADIGCITASNVHYSIPMKDKMTNKRDGLIGNGIVAKEEYDDTIETRCKAEAADSECWQLNEKGYKVWKFSSQS